MAGSLGFLGPAGTHSEAAAHYLDQLLGLERGYLEYGEIDEALGAVESGAVDACLVPVENSLEGAVNITLDTLARSDSLEVARELVWPVHNFLMGKGGHSDIKRVLSHVQPLSQCRRFLKENYPEAELVKVSSTARAAEMVADEPAASGWAAICPKRAGELHGLKLLASEIQDNMANCTRFFEVRRRGGAPPAKTDKMLIICQIDGKRAGSLCKVLEEFACRGVNMTRIESRPARTELGAYIFFFDLETDAPPEVIAESVAAVKKRSIWLRNLGAFPLYEVRS